jgi:hypothetical protein
LPKNWPISHYYDFVQLELPFELPAMHWHLYWQRSADKDLANIWLREKLMQFVQEGVATSDSA